MKGAGYYSRATIGATQVMDKAAGVVSDALDRMAPGHGSSVFRAMDVGAADGATFLDMWESCARTVWEQTDQPVEIIYADLSGNDFSRVFRQVHGLPGKRTYAQAVCGVYVMSSGASCHEVLVLPGMPHFGFNPTKGPMDYPCTLPHPRPRASCIWWCDRDIRVAYEAKGPQIGKTSCSTERLRRSPSALLLITSGATGRAATSLKRLWREHVRYVCAVLVRAGR